MRRALVLGAGCSGRAAEALLRSQGVDVRVLEGGDAFPCGDRNARPSAVSLALGCAPSCAATGMSPLRAWGRESTYGAPIFGIIHSNVD